MALGETQIVAETRDFLTENGVVLDSFSQVVMNFNGQLKFSFVIQTVLKLYLYSSNKYLTRLL